jgi:hypothetical protein
LEIALIVRAYSAVFFLSTIAQAGTTANAGKRAKNLALDHS